MTPTSRFARIAGIVFLLLLAWALASGVWHGATTGQVAPQVWLGGIALLALAATRRPGTIRRAPPHRG